MKRILKNPASRFWIAAALLLKASIFFYFVLQRDPNWNAALVAGPLALKQLDTEWYFQPLDAVLAGDAYDSVCKLPGFAPIYLPLRSFADKETAYNMICLIQVLLDALCTVLLAWMAMRLFKQQSIFYIVFLLYGCGTFISVRSNYVLSDSFCTSFFIIAVFLFQRGIENSAWRQMLGAGVLMLWSFEMRPVMLVVYPAFVILIFYHVKNWKSIGLALLLFVMPLVVASLCWFAHNRNVHQRSLWLIAPVEECMTHYGPESAAIRRFIIATGHDFQPWSKGSAAEWFLQRKIDLPSQSPFRPHDFSAFYNLDTLIQIRKDYKRIEQGDSLSPQYGALLISRMDKCTESYKQEHTFRYFISNRLGFLQAFLFPRRIDDLPLPPVTQMNGLHKLVKASSLFSLWIIHALALLGLVWAIKKRGWSMLWWSSLGTSSIVVLSWLGFIEQRYLTASYPISVLFASFALFHGGLWLEQSRARRKQNRSNLPVN